MSLLVLLDSLGGGPNSEGFPQDPSLLKAMVDAIHGSDDRVAGQRFTRLVTLLSETETGAMRVESNLGFGTPDDDLLDSTVLLIGGEIIEAAGREDGPSTFKFTSLTRGARGTTAKQHPIGTLVFDLSGNTSDLEHLRRGFLVNFALGADLDVVGRNLGLHKCPGLTDDQWREIIRTMAYLPKQPISAFDAALTALLGAGNFEIEENLVEFPFTVFVRISVGLSTSIRGRFVLNTGEEQLTTGLLQVMTDYPIIQSPLSDTLTELGAIPTVVLEGHTFVYPNSAVGTASIKVVDDTEITRRGEREGFTDYFTGGSATGQTITLGSSPGPIGTAVLVDYTAFAAHYLAEDETRLDDEDTYAYLADPLLAARCILDQVRAAGIKVELSTLL